MRFGSRTDPDLTGRPPANRRPCSRLARDRHAGPPFLDDHAAASPGLVPHIPALPVHPFRWLFAGDDAARVPPPDDHVFTTTTANAEAGLRATVNPAAALGFAANRGATSFRSTS